MRGKARVRIKPQVLMDLISDILGMHGRLWCTQTLIPRSNKACPVLGQANIRGSGTVRGDIRARDVWLGLFGLNFR